MQAPKRRSGDSPLDVEDLPPFDTEPATGMTPTGALCLKRLQNVGNFSPPAYRQSVKRHVSYNRRNSRLNSLVQLRKESNMRLPPRLRLARRKQRTLYRSPFIGIDVWGFVPRFTSMLCTEVSDQLVV